MLRDITKAFAAGLLGASALGGAALAVGASGSAASGDESSEGRIEIGYLECSLLTDEGNIIVSEQEFTCHFDPAEDGRPDEQYTGTVSKFGLDLSKTKTETLRWAVFAPADKYRAGVLEGEYAGVSADAALGVGVGGKVLVGGLRESVALQPIAMTTQKGLGVALAFESLKLTAVK